MAEHKWTWEEDGYTVVRTNARSAPGCHNSCGVLLYVKDGKLVKVEGDKENPYNQGRLCSRCLALTDVVYHKDRLQYPMKRVGKRGENKWARITWDEAYDTIYEKMNEIREKYGPWTVFFGQGTGRDIHQVTRLAYALGSPNEGVPYFTGSSCYLPRVASMGVCMGDACVADCSQFRPARYDDPEYVVPKCCIIWGHQPMNSNADGFFGHWITDEMQRGTELIVIDPQMTWVGARAKYWIRLRPGTDGAVAMAFLRVILDEELYDKDFCDKWVNGLEELKGRVQTPEYTVERMCETAWCDKETLVEAARFYAKSKPAQIQWGLAIDQATGGQQAAHAIMSLWSITGNLDVPGGNVIGRPCWGIAASNWTGGWGYEEILTEEQKASRLGTETYPLFNVGFLNMSPDVSMQALETGEPYEIHGAWLQTSNFLSCMGAQPERYLRAWQKLDFIVVTDIFMTPTMMALADIALPATTYAERIGFSGLDPYYIGAMVPGIPPVGDTKPDQQIMLDLGKRFNPEAWPWDTLEQVNDYALAQGGFTWKELRDASWKYPDFQYRKYEKGLLRDADHEPGFNTPTGKAEVYSTIFESMGLDALPSWVEPFTSPITMPEKAKKYPYVLTTGARVPHFFHSEHRQIKRLRILHPDPLVYMHSNTAKKHGVHEGDWVYLENWIGKAKFKVKLNDSWDERVINTDHAWWFPEGDPEKLFGTFDSNPNQLIAIHAGKSGFGGCYKAMMCNIVKIEN